MLRIRFLFLFNVFLVPAIGYTAADGSYLVPDDGQYGNSDIHNSYEIKSEYNNNNTSVTTKTNSADYTLPHYYGRSHLVPKAEYMNKEEQLDRSR